MPTNSKKVSKKNWFNKTFTEQKKRIDAFMARRPHRSFRLTRRRDYVRPLDLPGNISFTHHVTQILWQYKKIFGLLVVVYIVLFAVLVGVPLVHSAEDAVGLMDGVGGAFGEDVEVGVGDQGGDFDDHVVVRIKTGHLQVNPDQVVFVLHL